MAISKTPVFVWRAAVPPTEYLRGRCKYCGQHLTHRWLPEGERDADLTRLFNQELQKHLEYSGVPGPLTDDDDFWEYYEPGQSTCGRCGWWCNYLRYGNVGPTRTRAAGLLAFDVDDPRLAIPELVSHLARRFHDIFAVSPRRFEEVVAHVYRTIGWRVVLTQQSKDGGVDLICLENDSGAICIVECKRYAQDRSVGIDVVDRLIGVSYRLGANQADIVTTSRFTRPAAGAGAAEMAGERTLVMNLVDGHELLHLLRVYSDSSITVRDITAIFGCRTR